MGSVEDGPELLPPVRHRTTERTRIVWLNFVVQMVCCCRACTAVDSTEVF